VHSPATGSFAGAGESAESGRDGFGAATGSGSIKGLVGGLTKVPATAGVIRPLVIAATPAPTTAVLTKERLDIW
jgi:hypothetical protein